MTSLPPSGWDQLATKADLAALRSELDSKLASNTRTLVFANIGSILTVDARALGAARFG